MEDINLDLSDSEVLIEVPKNVGKQSDKKASKTDSTKETPAEFISCLTKEVITVRYIPRESGMITNPKHVFYGGMSENATRTFVTPILESNGQYVNILTNEEKVFLEEVMGLDNNALSIYKKEKNFWDDFSVRLTKGETYLDLSNPNDYIKYKVLLANKDFVASSLEELQNHPKVTFQYVLISENAETKAANLNLNATMEAYMEFGKIQLDVNFLRVLIETIDGRPTSAKSKLDFLQTQASKLLQADPKLFLQTVKDPLLPTKVILKRALEAGIVSKRGDYYYLRSDNSPLCENNEEPTLSMASKFLNMPKHQEIKLMIEAKLKD